MDANQLSPKEQVGAIIRAEMLRRHVPGAQVAVIRKGKLVYSKSFGHATLQFDVLVKNTTRFTINSATKSFTGVAIMQLVEAGKLNLSDPVGKYISELPEAWKPVTIRQLATHVSGIPNIIDQNTGNLVGDLEDQEAWAKVQTLPMEFVTNEKSSYNQTNYLLLGKVIDKVSGKPFVDFITENQFAAAKMSRTVFGDARDVIKDLAQAYIVDDSVVGAPKYTAVGAVFPKFLWTGAGICSTAEDIARWIGGLSSRRLLKSQQTLDEMWRQDRYSDGKPAAWGVGWPGSKRIQHRWFGGIGGARSAFYVYPDDDLAVVILTNLAGASPEEWIDSVARVFVPGIPKG